MMTDVWILGARGRADRVGLDAFADRLSLARRSRSVPFDSSRVELVVRFSESLSRDPRFADSIAMRAFAFWIRKGALTKLSRDFRKGLPENVVPVGRGIAFHLPPANVDTIFLYSWVTAFLAGNVGVTRLPSSATGPMKEALDVLIDLLAEGGLPDLFVSYPISESINRRISEQADLRLVWGGDAKAAEFSSMPVRLGGRALTFPDRYSYSVLSGEHLASLDQRRVTVLAKRLFNDVYLFDQMACSSPHLLYVVGAATTHGNALRVVLREVDRLAAAAGGMIEAAHAIEKFRVLAQLAAEGAADQADWFSIELATARLSSPIHPSVGGGFLGVRYIETLDSLIAEIRDRDQTLGYEGFSREAMAAFAEAAAPQGLCRIVPIGRALDFDAVWDGNDVLRDAVRLVRVL
jgi:hypothetical protein